MTELVPHYYGEVPGDPALGRETNLCKLECHKCREEFADNIEFYAHMKVHLFDHHLSNMLMCRYCVLQFRDQQELDKHVHETHNPTARPLVCRLCMMNFNTPTLLINHMVDKHVQAELPYRCQVCNYASSYYTKLIDHFEEAHRGGPYVLCHFCLYVRTVAPSNADKLSHWVLAHLNEHTRSVRCGFCVLTLKNKARRSSDAHMVVHATYKNRKDVAPYPLAGCLLRVAGARLGRPSAARPLIVAHQDPQDKMRPLLAMSRRQRVLGDVKARVGAEDVCKECDAPMSTPGHYRAKLRCALCCYATCCSAMMPRHNSVFHPPMSKRPADYELSRPIILKAPLRCVCGFASNSGNRIATHLAKCGKRTALPPASAAPVPAAVGPGKEEQGGHFLANLMLNDDDFELPALDVQPSVSMEED